jgi:CubicO group peptidase (beta-lactamase class C family)
MDYLRFAQMLVNEGELEGVRVLKPETVREMSRNHLPEEMIPIVIGGPDAGYGLGFGVSTTTGAYWWVGVANTYFWIDPVNDIVGMAWTQYLPFGAVPINQMLQGLVYESLLEAVPTG